MCVKFAPALPSILLIAASLCAQDSEAAFKTRLVHQPLYLRGQWAGDQLSFDDAGHLVGSEDTVPFTVSGIDIKSVKIEGGEMKLDGNRVALVFHNDTIVRKKLEHIQIRIQATANSQYKAVLDEVFTSELSDFVPTLPIYWQVYAGKHFLPIAGSAPPPNTQHIADQSSDASRVADHGERVKRIGGAVLPPRVLSQPEPQFDSYAKKLKLSGKVLIYAQVDRNGDTNHIRILKPLGAGLDEEAVKAVFRYKFAPAEENGKPIAVELNVELDFRVF